LAHEQKLAPNQEIVLQFTNHDTTSNHAQDVIAAVQYELQSIGAENIKVDKDKNGRLKITYYSNEAIAIIKSRLATKESNTLGFVSIDDKDLEHYNFDVFEIENTSDSSSDFGGKCIVEYKQDFDRFSKPNKQPHGLGADNKFNCFILKTALKTNKAIAIAIDNTSYNIPEVRAGPQV